MRGILRNPAYAGRALSNRTQVAPARGRKSAMLPAGPGQSHAPRPEEDWIAVPVPPVVSEETFAQVQAKLDANQQGAARNTRHEYLLRALISCGACRLGCTGRQTAAGYRYYLCRGRTDPLRVAQGQRCTARYIPAGQLDELVWADLCALLTDPAQIARALARAQGGAWLPQELQARQATIGQALGQLERQQQRLLDAYLAEVIALAELDRKRQDLDRRRGTLLAQQRQLDAAARQKLELGAVAGGIEAFCQTVRAGLATATFEQRRLLAELLIDRVIITDGQVEIRYVLPTSPDGPHRPFCQLRKDHLDSPPGDGHLDQLRQRHRVRGPAQVAADGAGGAVAADQQVAVPGAAVADGDPGPVVVALSLGALAGREPLPGPFRQPGGQLIGPQRAAGAGGHPVVAGDCEDVGDVLFFQPAAQRPVVPVDLIAGHPAERYPGRCGSPDHLPRQLRLGGEPRVRGDPGGGAAFRVVGPGLRQVQLPVDQRVPGRGRIPQVDRDLRVLDPARGAGVLPLYARRGGPLLQVTGLINDQHRPRVAEVPGDVAAHVVTDPFGIPLGPGQQVLHPVRRGIAGVLGERPAVHPRQLRQQPQRERPRPPPRLRPAETGPGPDHQLIQYSQPPARVYAGASGHQKVITSRHKPR